MPQDSRCNVEFLFRPAFPSSKKENKSEITDKNMKLDIPTEAGKVDMTVRELFKKFKKGLYSLYRNVKREGIFL